MRTQILIVLATVIVTLVLPGRAAGITGLQDPHILTALCLEGDTPRIELLVLDTPIPFVDHDSLLSLLDVSRMALLPQAAQHTLGWYDITTVTGRPATAEMYRASREYYRQVAKHQEKSVLKAGPEILLLRELQIEMGRRTILLFVAGSAGAAIEWHELSALCSGATQWLAQGIADRFQGRNARSLRDWINELTTPIFATPEVVITGAAGILLSNTRDLSDDQIYHGLQDVMRNLPNIGELTDAMRRELAKQDKVRSELRLTALVRAERAFQRMIEDLAGQGTKPPQVGHDLVEGLSYAASIFGAAIGKLNLSTQKLFHEGYIPLLDEMIHRYKKRIGLGNMRQQLLSAFNAFREYTNNRPYDTDDPKYQWLAFSLGQSFRTLLTEEQYRLENDMRAFVDTQGEYLLNIGLDNEMLQIGLTERESSGSLAIRFTITYSASSYQQADNLDRVVIIANFNLKAQAAWSLDGTLHYNGRQHYGIPIPLSFCDNALFDYSEALLNERGPVLTNPNMWVDRLLGNELSTNHHEADALRVIPQFLDDYLDFPERKFDETKLRGQGMYAEHHTIGPDTGSPDQQSFMVRFEFESVIEDILKEVVISVPTPDGQVIHYTLTQISDTNCLVERSLFGVRGTTFVISIESFAEDLDAARRHARTELLR